MRPSTAGIVLAGGRSSRFGSDKALAPWAGGTMIAGVLAALEPVVDERLVVAKSPDRYVEGLRGVRPVRDGFSAHHPLAGIAAGLRAARAPWAFVCACDMPLLQPALVRILLASAPGHDAVVPVWEGRPQALCAVYSTTCLDSIDRLLREDGSVEELFTSVRTLRLGEATVARLDPLGLSFMDIDTPADRTRIEEILHAGAG